MQTMKSTLIRLAVPIFSCLLFSIAGCATYPLGLSKEQWVALSPEKQAELQARQYEIDQQNRQAAEARRLEQERAAAERARLEQERIAALYANARYGDIVTVTIAGGTMTEGSGRGNAQRYRVEPVSFDLIRGETKLIDFRGTAPARNGSIVNVEKIPASLSPDGNNLILNSGAAFDSRRVVIANTGWERGVTQMINFVDKWGASFQGIPVTIRLKSLQGEPQRVIIEHR